MESNSCFIVTGSERNAPRFGRRAWKYSENNSYFVRKHPTNLFTQELRGRDVSVLGERDRPGRAGWRLAGQFQPNSALAHVGI